MGFADLDRETLLTLRGNLLSGLDRLVSHAEGATLHDVPPPRASTPPIASGWLMAILLDQVNAELRGRRVTAVVVPTR